MLHETLHSLSCGQSGLLLARILSHLALCLGMTSEECLIGLLETIL